MIAKGLLVALWKVINITMFPLWLLAYGEVVYRIRLRRARAVAVEKLTALQAELDQIDADESLQGSEAFASEEAEMLAEFAAEQKKRRKPRPIDVERLREIWGMDIPDEDLPKLMDHHRGVLRRKAKEIGLPLRTEIWGAR